MAKGKLASKIKKSRTEARLSQGELGKSIGLSDKSVSAYEAGRAAPPLSVLEKISRAVGKPVSYFLGAGDETEFSVAAKLTAVEKQLIEIKKLLANQRSSS